MNMMTAALTAAPAEGVPGRGDRGRLVARAKSLYRERKRRSAAFQGLGYLFGEPAWDMLLDLFIAFHDGRHLSTTSVARAGDGPVTTGIRHLHALEKAGLVERYNDRADARRRFFRLSPLGVERMTDCLERSA